jgi:hypothetical protein
MLRNLDISHLIAEANRLGRHRTKKEAVTAALDEYIQRRKHWLCSLCLARSSTMKTTITNVIASQSGLLNRCSEYKTSPVLYSSCPPCKIILDWYCIQLLAFMALRPIS